MEAKDERVNILGTFFSCLDLDEGIKRINNYNKSKSSYICFPSTGLISEAYKDNKLREIYNNSYITFADGKFTEFYAKLKGHRNLKNVSGYWLLERLLRTNLTHYFYGCSEEDLYLLEDMLKIRFPDANIIGFKSPPFIELHEVYPNKKIIKDIEEINSLRPDLIWIGISSPKQDYLMYHYKDYLERGIMLGVGAVFLYQAGLTNKGPEIIKKLSLRWLWRLFQDPRRLGKRSLSRIANFLILILKTEVFKRNKG